MSKPILVAAAAACALAISACGGGSPATPAATCRHGKAIGVRFNADLEQWAMAVQANPVAADPSRVRRDLGQLSSMVTTLSQEDTNAADLQQLADAKRGIGAFGAGLAQLHTGNLVGYLHDLRRGGADLRDLAGGSLAICASAGV
jgi:hypothetical protein